MITMNKYMEILGLRVVDCITGFSGVASSVCFDLYGCVQVAVTPSSVDGKLEDGRWFDHKRLTITDPKPVMAAPSFVEVDGPSELPRPRQ